jgi:hypothetical protein
MELYPTVGLSITVGLTFLISAPSYVEPRRHDLRMPG